MQGRGWEQTGKGLRTVRKGAEMDYRKWLEAGREGVRNRQGRGSELAGKALRCFIVKWL